MRFRLILMVLFAASLAGPTPAWASDGGGDTTSADGGAQPSSVADGGGSEAGAQDAATGAGSSEAEDAASVVACDGDLCDTLQGRPSCSVARRPIGGASGGPTGLAGAWAAVALCMVRRTRRGASRPGKGGSCVISCPTRRRLGRTSPALPSDVSSR
ncbi:MAG: hypothetical protein ABSF69_06265 [Polyangiaceae bacterium]